MLAIARASCVGRVGSTECRPTTFSGSWPRLSMNRTASRPWLAAATWRNASNEPSSAVDGSIRCARGPSAVRPLLVTSWPQFASIQAPNERRRLGVWSLDLGVWIFLSQVHGQGKPANINVVVLLESSRRASVSNRPLILGVWILVFGVSRRFMERGSHAASRSDVFAAANVEAA
jgi:hypothetical protein